MMLEYPDGIIRGQHRHPRTQSDARGSGGNAGKDGFRSGNRKIITVVLPQDDRIDSHLISENRLRDNIANNVGEGKGNTAGTMGHVTKRAKTELDILHGLFPSQSWPESTR